MEEVKETKRIRCEECNSAFGYVRSMSKTWKCRICNHIQDLGDKTD